MNLKCKSSILTIVLFCGTMVGMATQTAKVTITIAGATYPSSGSSLVLVENTDRLAEYESAYDVAALLENVVATQTPYLLGLVANNTEVDSCERVETNSLVGLQLVLMTNGVLNGACDDTYTMTFSNISGHAIALRDNVADSIITIENGMSPATYTFTVDATVKGQQRILNRFEIIDPAEIPTVYSLCYSYGSLIVNNPAAAGTAYVLDSAGINIEYTKEIPSQSTTSFYPTSLVSGRLYQLVGLQNDTVFFRAK